MPGHTPEEKAKNAAARSIQPGPDLQGGSAAVQDDAGFTTRLEGWREYLRRPEIQAGLLQFGAQMLQTNPGGFGPAFGTSVAAGLGAVGRVSKLQREQGQERAAGEAKARQQDLENQLDERRVTEIEKRTKILGRPRVGKSGKSDKELTLAKQYEEFFQGDPEFGEEILDPGTLGRLGRSASAATNDVDGDFMAACQAIGNTARSCAETYMDPQLRSDMKNATGLISGPSPAGDGTADPDAVGKEKEPKAPLVRRPGESPLSVRAREDARSAVEGVKLPENFATAETSTNLGDIVDTFIVAGSVAQSANRIFQHILGLSEDDVAAFLSVLQERHPDVHAQVQILVDG